MTMVASHDSSMFCSYALTAISLNYQLKSFKQSLDLDTVLLCIYKSVVHLQVYYIRHLTSIIILDCLPGQQTGHRHLPLCNDCLPGQQSGHWHSSRQATLHC